MLTLQSCVWLMQMLAALHLADADAGCTVQAFKGTCSPFNGTGRANVLVSVQGYQPAINCPLQYRIKLELCEAHQRKKIHSGGN